MNRAITTIHNILKGLTGFAIKRAGVFVVVSVLFTALAAWYAATHIQVHTETDEMIDPSLPFRQTYDDFNQAFPQFSNSFIMVVDGVSPEAAEAAQKRLYGELGVRSDLYTGLYAPGIGQFFEQNAFLLMDTEKLGRMTDDLAAAEPVLAAISEDPSLRGLFDVLSDAMDDAIDGDDPNEKLDQVLGEFTGIAKASAEGRSAPLSWQGIFLNEQDLKTAKRRIVVVQPVLDFTKLQAAKQALVSARALAREVEGQVPGVTIRFTGKIALNSDELKSVTDSSLISGLLSFLLVALVLGFGIRSWRLVVAALATLFMGLIWTGAFALLAIGYLNIISVAFAVLFIGLGIDFAIHFSLRYQEEAHRGVTTDNALLKTAVYAGGPLALCAPTTALAFYAFVPTEYAGLAQLGLIAGTGIFVSFFTSLTVLPALLKVLHSRGGHPEYGKHAKEEASLIEHYGRGIAIAGFVLGAVALFFVRHVDFDFDPINLKDPNSESVQTFFNLQEGEKTTPYVLQILSENMDQGEAMKPDLKALPLVDDVVTLKSFVPKDQDEKLSIIDTAYLFMNPVFLNRGLAAPPSADENILAVETFRQKAYALFEARPDLAAAKEAVDLADIMAAFEGTGATDDKKRALLEDNLFANFPVLLERIENGLSPTEEVTLTDIPQNLKDRYVAADGRYRLEVFPAENLSNSKNLEAFVRQVTAVAANATGSPVQIYNAGLVVKGAMSQASLTAGIIIIIFLLIILRRISSVILIIIPVALAALFTGAIMVIFGLSFNFANVIVIPLLIGLGVDSGIHLVQRAREEHEEKTKLLASSTPKAVLLSALTTIGSFGTLAISSHQGTASMGILLTVSIAMILLATLLVLPGLMVWIEKAGKSAKK